jgi:hypothetical protein
VQDRDINDQWSAEKIDLDIRELLALNVIFQGGRVSSAGSVVNCGLGTARTVSGLSTTSLLGLLRLDSIDSLPHFFDFPHEKPGWGRGEEGAEAGAVLDGVQR